MDAESAGAKERLDALNKKIEYLEQEMKLVDNDVENGKADVASLQRDCEENEKAILTAEKDIEILSEELNSATNQFDENYEAYRQRLRAMYISGDTSILAFLLTSDDISQLLTRLEMLRSVSKKDSELLDSILSEMEEIKTSQKELTEREAQLTVQRTALLKNKEKLEKSIIALEEKQNSLNEKKTNLSAEMVGANTLIKKLSEETGYYTEFLEDNRESLDEIDRKLAAAASKYADTVVTTTATTAAASGNNEAASSTTDSTTKKIQTAIYILPILFRLKK